MSRREIPESESEGESYERWLCEVQRAEWETTEAKVTVTPDVAPMVYVGGKEDQDMVTIIEVNHATQTLWARTVDADAASGTLVLPGKPTDQEIIDAANEQLPEPDTEAEGTPPTYDGYAVEWTD